MIEMAKWVLDNIISRLKSPWALFILIIIGIFAFAGTDVAKEHIGSPVWSFVKGEGYEAVQSDIPLKGGEIIVYPQIVVTCKGIVVFIVNIDCLYEENTTSITLKSDEDRQYRLYIDKEQQNKYDRLLIEFPQMLEAQLDESQQYKMGFCEIYEARLMKIEYQTVDSNRSRINFFYVENGNQRIIQHKEAAIRKTDYYIDLDKSTDSDVRKIVIACAEAITMME